MAKLALVVFLCFFMLELSGSIRLKTKKRTSKKKSVTKPSGKVNMSLAADSSNASFLDVSSSSEASGATRKAHVITSSDIAERGAESSGAGIGMTGQDESQSMHHNAAPTPQDGSGRKLLEPTKSLQAAIWSWKWKHLLREKTSQNLFSDMSRFFGRLDSSVKDIIVSLKSAANISPGLSARRGEDHLRDDWKDLRKDVESFLKKWTDRFHKHYLKAIQDKMVELEDPDVKEFQKMVASGKLKHGMNLENWVYSEKASKDIAQKFCLSNFDEPLQMMHDVVTELITSDDPSDAKELADEIMKSLRITWPVFVDHLEKFCDFTYEAEDDDEEVPFARIVAAEVLEPLIKDLVEWTQEGGDAALSEPLVREMFHKIGELEKLAESQEARDREKQKTSEFHFEHFRLVTGDDGELRRHPEQIRSLVEPGFKKAEESLDGLNNVVQVLVEKQTEGQTIIADDKHSEDFYKAALNLSESVANLEDASAEFAKGKLDDQVDKKLHHLIERMSQLIGKMTELFQKEHR